MQKKIAKLDHRINKLERQIPKKTETASSNAITGEMQVSLPG